MKQRVLRVLKHFFALLLCWFFTTSALTVWAQVQYLEYNTTTGAFDSHTSPSAITVTSSTTTMGAANTETWYVVSSNDTVSTRIEVRGTVNLILADGDTLTALMGIHVPNGDTIRIYAQSDVTGIMGMLLIENGGIGTHAEDGGGSTIVIHGGEIFSQGFLSAAGIGGGGGCNGGTITIHGGKITAKGGFGAGIGGGKNIGGGIGGKSGNITITGGTVTAIHGANSAGIGGGHDGDADTISITGGTVTAYGNPGTSGNAPAIGRGSCCNMGTLLLGNVKVYNSDTATTPVLAGSRVATCRTNTARLESCTEHTWENGTCKYCGATTCHVTYDANNATSGTAPTDATDYISYDIVTVLGNTGNLSRTGYTFDGWNTQADGNGTDYTPGTTFNISSSVTLYAKWAVEYLAYNTGSQQFETRTASTYTVVNSGTTTMGAADTETWYVVNSNNSNITVNNRINVRGTVNLILCDNKTLTANVGLEVPEGTTLNIYGQRNGTGTLTAVIPPGQGYTGIGGNNYNSDRTGGTISIHGGYVTATGGPNSAGIGGSYQGSCGTITIYGGYVTATGGGSGAGISGGNSGAGGNVIIYGGTVNATGTTAAGIGGGNGANGGNVTIYGGTVTATGGDRGAGIGGGQCGSGGNVTITGGTVTAIAGDGGAQAIGRGYLCSNTQNEGSLTLVPMKVFANSTATEPVASGSRVSTCRSSYAKIELCTEHHWNGNDHCSYCDTTCYGVAYHANNATSGTVPETITFIPGKTATIVGNMGNLEREGYVFAGWNTAANGNGTDYAVGASTNSTLTLYAKWMPAVEYLAYNTTTNEFETLTAPAYTVVTASTTTMGAANTETWYVVNENVTVSERIEVLGTVNLILCDGKTLTASKGLNVPNGKTIKIYGQSGGTGKVVATINNKYDYGKAGIGGNSYQSSGNVIIHGGSVTAKGNAGAGIGGGQGGGGGTVTIYGGNVSATGGEDAAGIGGGRNGNGATLNVYGGVITAIRGSISHSPAPQAIGRGCDFNSSNPAAGTINIIPSMKVFASANATEPVEASQRVSTCRSAYAKLEHCDHNWVDNVCTWCGAVNTGVAYGRNYATSGTAPVDTTSYTVGQTVTVLGNMGNLERTGYIFAGWNTQANGLGTYYAADATFTFNGPVTLYAKWATVTRDTACTSYTWTPIPTHTEVLDETGLYTYRESEDSGEVYALYLTIMPNIEIIISKHDACDNQCVLNNNGEITVTVENGGFGDGFDFVWTKPGDTSFTSTNTHLEDLSAGTYQFTMTDKTAFGNPKQHCSISGDVVIEESPLINYTISNDANCVDTDDGIIVTTLNGGTTPFTLTFTYPTSDTVTHTVTNLHEPDTLKNLANGEYSMTITDANGCYVNIDHNATTLLDDNHPILSLSAYGLKKVYDGIPVNADTFYVKAEWPGETTTTDTLPSGSDWECGGWSGADILHATVSAGQGLFHVDSVPNLLTYTITSTSGKDVACRYRVTVKDSSVVILCAPLSTTSLVDTQYCFNSTAKALTTTPAGGDGSYTYQWQMSSDNGATWTDLSTVIGSHTPSTTVSGTFKYKVTVTSGSGCGSLEKTATVTVYDAFDVTEDKPNANYCKDATAAELSVSVTGSGDYSYQWYANGTAIAAPRGTSTTLTPGTSNYGTDTTYSVNVTDNTCLTDKTVEVAKAHVWSELAFSGDPEVNNVACHSANTGSIMVTVTGGTPNYSYKINDETWTTGSTETSHTFNDRPAGNYTITVKDGCNTKATTATITITEPNELAMAKGDSTDIACHGQSTGTAQVHVTGGSTAAKPYKYQLDGTAESPFTSNADSTFTGLAAGTHTIKVTDNCGISKTVVFNPKQPDELSASNSTVHTDTSYCPNETADNISVTVTNGTAPYTYTWYGNGMVITDAVTATYTPTTTTSGSDSIFYVVVKDACGATATVNPVAHIKVYDAVTVSTTSSNTAYCKDETSVNTLNVSIAGGSGTAHYQWYKNGAAISGANTDTYAPETGTPGNFDYSVKVSNDCGGDSIPVATITINPLPTITATPPSQTIPYGNSISTVVITNTNSIVLTPTLPTGFVYDPAGQTIDAASPAAGVYTITVSAESNTTPNCGTVTAEVKVEVKNDNTPIVISSGNNSWKYNGAARSEETYTVTYGSTTVTDVDASGKVFTLPSGDKVTISNPASITNVSETADHNNTYSYTLDHASYYTNVTATYGKLTILPRTVVMTSASDSKMYDGTPLTRNNQSDVTVTGDGFVTGEGATYNITGSQKSAGSSANAFTYTLNGGTLAENYTTSTVNGMLEVTKHPFTISLDSVKVYDGAPFMVTASQLHVTGFVNNDALASGEMWTESGEVGEYENQDGSFQTTLASGIIYKGGFSILDSSGSSVTSCYTPTFKVKLSISPCTITITAATDAKSYDGTPLTNSGYSITAGALVSSDNLASCIVTGSQLCLGSSPNVPSGAVIKNGTDDVTGNYTIHYVNGTLTVTQATGFSCPPAETFYLDDCAANMTVTLTGTPTVTGVAAGHYTVTNNLASLNPMGAGTHTVTWSLLDDCNNVVATCDQTVKVDYKPCVGVTWQGHFYDAVRVGSQCWLAENIRWATGNHAAYKEGSTNLDKFGYLYSWYTAVGVNEDDDSAIPTTKSGTCGEPYVQGICPDGWGVGSEADFSLLNATAGSTDALKEMSSLYWLSSYEGTLPNTGFNSRGGGWYNSSLARYEDLMTGAHFWCSDATPGSTTFSSVFTYYCDETLATHSRKTDKMSVRCIRKVMP